MSRPDRRGTARWELVAELNRQAANCRALVSAIGHDVDHAIAITDALAADLTSDHELVLVRELRRAVDLASNFEDYSARLRTIGQPNTRTPRHARIEAQFLNWLAWLLPTDERSRFVAESLGNLDDCEHWWQRVDHLLCLALGTPRLAWMMWHDSSGGDAKAANLHFRRGRPPSKIGQTVLGVLAVVGIIITGLAYSSVRGEALLPLTGEGTHPVTTDVWIAMINGAGTIVNTVNAPWPDWIGNVANLGGLVSLMVAAGAYVRRRAKRARR